MTIRDLSGEVHSLLAGEQELSGGTEDSTPANNPEPRTSVAFGNPEEGDIHCDPVSDEEGTAYSPAPHEWNPVS